MIENPNLAEHPVDNGGGETRRRDGPVIGESASVDAPRALRVESSAGDDHAVEAPRAHRAESNASSPTKFPIPTIEAPMRALIGRILREDHQQLYAPRAEATSRAITSGGNITRHYERTQLHAPLQRPTPCVSFILGVIILQWGQGAGEPSRACYPLLQQYVCRFPGPIRELL